MNQSFNISKSFGHFFGSLYMVSTRYFQSLFQCTDDLTSQDSVMPRLCQMHQHSHGDNKGLGEDAYRFNPKESFVSLFFSHSLRSRVN